MAILTEAERTTNQKQFGENGWPGCGVATHTYTLPSDAALTELPEEQP